MEIPKGEKRGQNLSPFNVMPQAGKHPQSSGPPELSADSDFANVKAPRMSPAR